MKGTITQESPGSFNMVYKLDNFKCTFTTGGFQSQCGVTVLHGFSMYENGDIYLKAIGEQFALDLAEYNSHRSRVFGTGGKFLASAVTKTHYDRDNPYNPRLRLSKLLDNKYWTKGPDTKNRNSSNYIAMYELDPFAVSAQGVAK